MTVRSSGKQGAASERIARFLWTPELDAWLLQQCAEARARGFTPDYMGMARSLGVSKDALRMHEAYLRQNKPEPPNTPTFSPPPVPTLGTTIPNTATLRYDPKPSPKDVHDILELPPKVLDVPRPMRPELRTKGAIKTAVVFTDTHLPFHDTPAIRVIEALLVDARPDKVVHLGDLLDCYAISRFAKDPVRLHALQGEIDLARVFLAQWRDLAPQAECYLLEGNHEDRLRKTIWDLPGGAAELSRLTAFQRSMEWPHLLGLPEMHWDWVPTGQQVDRRIIMPKLITKHGSVVRKWSAHSGKGEMERHGRGGLSGHAHRAGAFYHADDNGARSWHELGCTCTLTPEYLDHPDWQHACAVVSYTEDWYHVELVYIQEGRAVWRGTQYLSP